MQPKNLKHNYITLIAQTFMEASTSSSSRCTRPWMFHAGIQKGDILTLEYCVIPYVNIFYVSKFNRAWVNILELSDLCSSERKLCGYVELTVSCLFDQKQSPPVWFDLANLFLLMQTSLRLAWYLVSMPFNHCNHIFSCHDRMIRLLTQTSHMSIR